MVSVSGQMALRLMFVTTSPLLMFALDEGLQSLEEKPWHSSRNYVVPRPLAQEHSEL